MKTFYVMWCTDANHTTQISKVEAENAGDAKAIVRDRAQMRVHFISIEKMP